MQCDASRFKIEEWGKNGKTISTSKHVIKFKFNCSVRPFRTFDVSFDPESESTRIFVQMAQHPMSMSMSGLFGPFFPFPVGFARFVFPIFPIFPLLFAFLFDFFLTMCSKEWPCRESKTLKTKSTCSPLFPLFRPHHPHPHHPSPVNFSKGTGIHTRRIEELQLQSCQAMSGHIKSELLIFCFGWLGFFLFVILNVWGQPPQPSNQMNPNEMINIHDENKRWHCGTKYSQFVLCLLFLCLNMLLSRLSRNNRKNKHHEVSMSITMYQRRTLGFTSTLNQALGTMALWRYEQHLGLCFNVFNMSVNLQLCWPKFRFSHGQTKWF